MTDFVSFMREVISELQMRECLGTAHVYRSCLRAIIAFRGQESFPFAELTIRWLKKFEAYLRGRKCRWNTVSTYLRTLRAVYNRAVDAGRATYVPRLFCGVYTGTRADCKRALEDADVHKLFGCPSAKLKPDMRYARDLMKLMFLLRGIPFVDLVFLRKADLHDGVITYRRRKTGRVLAVRLTPEAKVLLERYASADEASPYLFPLLRSQGGRESYREYQQALRWLNRQLALLGVVLGLSQKISSYTARHTWATAAYHCEVHPGIISEALGHSSVTVTETYLKPFKNKKIDEANEKVISFVKRMTNYASY